MGELGDLKKALELGTQPPFYVGLVVVSPDRRKILLAQRREDGIWTGPGGGANWDETPKQAAIREAFEEANLVLDQDDLEELPIRYSGNGRPVHCFLVKLKERPKLGVQHDPDKEVAAWEWRSIDEALPEPMDKNRAETILHGKMKLAGLMKGPKIVTEAEDMVEEHERVVEVLESPSHKDDEKEAKKQRKELAEYRKKLKEGLKKGKPAPIGTISPSGKYVKVAENQWVPYNRGHHKVSLTFTHNGKKYSHDMLVNASGHDQAREQAINRLRMLEAKIGRVNIEGVRTEPVQMKKSIVQTNVIGIDINTVSESVDELASRGSEWVSRIEQAVEGLDYADEPRSIYLGAGSDCTMWISKVDDGVYSAVVKREAWTTGEAGEVILQLQKMTIPAMVQALKAKEILERPEPQKAPEPVVVVVAEAPQLEPLQGEQLSQNQEISAIQPPETEPSSDVESLLSALKQLGSSGIVVQGDLNLIIKKGGFPIGTVRTYSDGKRYQKVAEGVWNPVKEQKQPKKEEPAKEPGKPQRLIHYSNTKGLKTIDPKKMGTSGVAGAESKRGRPEVERSYFYREGTAPEEIVKQPSKAKYTAMLDPEKQRIYDIGKDPEGIVEQAVKDNQGAYNSDKVLQAVKDAGYHGFENSGSALPGAVGLFNPHEVASEHEPDEEIPPLLEADEGRPKNDLPKDPAFQKAGSEVSEEDVKKFIGEFEKDFQEIKSMLQELKGQGAQEFAARLKDKNSLLGKMHGRLKDRSLSTVTDVIGARTLSASLQDQKKVLDAVKNNLDIVEIDDSVDKPRKDGYRAVHILFKTPSGKIGELQLKTLRQQVYSGFTHDAIYKGKPEIKNDPEVQRFTKELSDYLYALDKGEQDKPESRPKEPEALVKEGITFPWDKVEDLVKKAKEKGIKYFVTVRNDKKENEDTLEFSSFEEAKKYAETAYKNGHKGELPIGYGSSKDSYLQVFSEYQKGPGSRGGKVVGYDSKGNPRYASQLKKK